RTDQRIRHAAVAVDPVAARMRIGLPAHVFKLIEQRPPTVETIDREAGAQLRDRGELEAALRWEPTGRVEILPGPFGGRLFGFPGGLAHKSGANRVVGLAEEPSVRTRARYLADPLAAERPGEHQVSRHFRPRIRTPVAAPFHIVDGRADERPVRLVSG